MIKTITTLAIETAIRGGSLSLLKDEQEIDFWIGKKDVSKAEDVLEQISALLKNNGIKKIDLLAVSKGPGSSTGIRIGLATALGLKKPFDCGIIEVSVFKALTYKRIFNEPTILALPVGSRQISWVVFEKDLSIQKYQAAETEVGDMPVFLKLLNDRNFSKVILHSDLRKIVSNSNKRNENIRVEIMDDKFATLVGLKGREVMVERQSPSAKDFK